MRTSSISTVAALLAGLLSATLFGAEPPASMAPNIEAHLEQLASDEFEGRAPGTRGETLTINYLAEQFKRAGAAPGNPDGTYFQKVPLVGYTSVPKIEVEAGGQTTELKFLEDFVHDTVALRTAVSVKHAGIVFAGHGIVAPAWGWDDYKNLDVRNKLVIVLSGEPKSTDPGFFKGDTRTWYSSRSFKFDLAESKGAAGILVVTDPSKSDTFSIFQTFAKMEGCALSPSGAKSPTLIAGLITTQAARRLLQLGGLDLDSAKPGALPGVTAGISVRSRLRPFVSHNVVARVAGTDPLLKDEYVVYTAHWDHLGKDPTLTGDPIYNGAIDDGVGTAQLLEIARGFAASKGPRRSILFMATTAEEKGYLGSRHYARRPLYPIAKTVANFNLDGGNVWGVTADVTSSGYGLSTLDESLAQAARQQGRKFIEESLDDNGLYFASDQIEFARVGVPAVFPFSGFEYVGKPKEYGEQKWSAFSSNDYHKPSDEVRPDWDYSGAALDAQWLRIAGELVANADQRPEWKSASEFARR
jgi:Zn-dependent M28 family amino/carboxypeptidase